MPPPSLLYDVMGDRWDREVVSALGLDARLLAPLLPSAGALAGHLVAGAGTELGLPAGIPVAAGAADTAAAALGSGVGPGDIQLTVGTGAQVIRPLVAPVSRAEAGGQPLPARPPRTAGTRWAPPSARDSASTGCGRS